MEKIASFTINHLKLLPGVYVSRKDAIGSETLTTFDLRMTATNREPGLTFTTTSIKKSPIPSKASSL